MHAITEEEFTRDVDPIFRQVFIGNEDTEPFLPEIKQRLIVYFPLGGDLERNDRWERQLFEAINLAVNIIGDTGCYFAAGWEILQEETKENRYAYIPTSEFREAFVEALDTGGVWERLDLIDELFGFCLCSANSNWGLLKTMDDHAFLGGSTEFMKVILDTFPDIEEQVLEWLYFFKDEYGVKWFEKILSHVYGSNNAEKMMINSGLV